LALKHISREKPKQDEHKQLQWHCFAKCT